MKQVIQGDAIEFDVWFYDKDVSQGGVPTDPDGYTHTFYVMGDLYNRVSAISLKWNGGQCPASTYVFNIVASGTGFVVNGYNTAMILVVTTGELAFGIYSDFVFTGYNGFSGKISITMPDPWTTGPLEYFTINDISQAEPTYDLYDENNTIIENNVLMTNHIQTGLFRQLIIISTTAVCGENWRIIARGTILGQDTFVMIPFRVIDKGQALAEMAKLVTLSELKTDMEITDTRNDAVLESLILPASQAIENHCFQKFHEEGNVWIFDGNDGGRIHLNSNGPILSIQNLEYRTEGTNNWYALSTDGYTFNDFFISRIDGLVFDEGMSNWRLTYTYGVLIVPSQVKKAVYELIKYWTAYKNRVGVLRDNMGGGLQVDYAAVTDQLPNNVKQLLINYRRLG